MVQSYAAILTPDGEVSLVNPLPITGEVDVVARRPLLAQTKTVTCPLVPMQVPGITTADALDALDTVGSLFFIATPPSGIIKAARWYDPSDQGSEINVHVFSGKVTLSASDAAWTLNDDDSLRELDTLEFTSTSFVDNIANRYARLTDIAIPYSTRIGGLWFGAATPAASTPTYTAPAFPRLQLVILTDDPDWQEV